MSELRKLFSDVIHGFISVSQPEILSVIQLPQVQRLRRIRQLGVGHLVYPCAEHSRFTHALGTLALMQEALRNLEHYGTPISAEEHLAASVAALLHDIGHGPFSHSLESELIPEVSHEAIGQAIMAHFSDVLEEPTAKAAVARLPLDLALRMIQGLYDRPFFHHLLVGQMDLDRLDYLQRDSHFTGVVEGRVGCRTHS